MNPKAPFYPESCRKEVRDGQSGVAYEVKAQGITTRDYIAIEAMKALLTQEANTDHSEASKIVARKKGIGRSELIAVMAYELADTLIAESNKK